MNDADITQLLREAEKYPLALRIAARIHAAGISEDQYIDMPSKNVPVVRNNVHNYLRDIARGKYANDKLLFSLANDL